jgi:actin-related protein
MGYAGNAEPSFIVPTAIAAADDGASDVGRGGASDLDYHVGDAALAHSKTHGLSYPIRHGLVDNWTNMERLWSRCFAEHLHVQPSEHYVLLVRRVWRRVCEPYSAGCCGSRGRRAGALTSRHRPLFPPPPPFPPRGPRRRSRR